jgi:hypothetical protein
MLSGGDRGTRPLHPTEASGRAAVFGWRRGEIPGVASVEHVDRRMTAIGQSPYDNKPPIEASEVITHGRTPPARCAPDSNRGNA